MQTMAAWSDGTRLVASKFQWQFLCDGNQIPVELNLREIKSGSKIGRDCEKKCIIKKKTSATSASNVNI